jgi:hypothetical protein
LFLLLLQINYAYVIQVHGLSQLKNKLDPGLPINLYFVVPDIHQMFETYCSQNYVTVENKVYTRWDINTKWIRDDVVQYVLLIDWGDFN